MCNLKFHFWMESIVNDLPCTAYGHRHYHYMTVRNVVRFRLLWPCYPCVGTWPKQSDEAGLDFLSTWTLTAWAGHRMIRLHKFSRNFEPIKHPKILQAIFHASNTSKKPKKVCVLFWNGEQHMPKKKSNLDPNKNKLFFCGVIKLLMDHCYHSLLS